MKMRFLAFFLTLCLIFTMTPADVFAVTFDGQDGFGAGEETITEVTEEATEEATEEVTEIPAEEPAEIVDEAEDEAETVEEDPEEDPEEETEIPGEGCTAHEDGMHVHETVVTAPTCTEQGYTTYTCACGNIYVADYVDALGHNMENGVCTLCGEREFTTPVVTASNIEETGKILVTWKPVAGAVKYKVYRATKIDGVYTRMVTTAATSYANTGAKTGVTYYYKVIALGADGKAVSYYSEAAACTCTLARPVITVSNVEKTGKIMITWEPVEGAVAYEIYRSNTKNGTYSRIRTATSTKFTNTGAVAGQTYYYKVKAVAEDTAANSAMSAAQGRACDLARPVVTLSNVEKTGKILVTWEAVEGAVSYNIYRAESEAGPYTLLRNATSTKLTNTNVTPGQTYYYKVKAMAENTAANSALSAAKGRCCDLAQPVVTSSNIPETGKVQLTWQAVNGAVQYNIYRAEAENGPYTLMHTTTGTVYNNIDSVSGMTYYYKVRAIAEVSSANSAYSAVKARACDFPRPVASGIADIDTGKPVLTWEAVEGATGYKIYRSESIDGTYKLMYTATETTYKNTKCEIGKTYYYKVRAVGENAAAASAYSDVVTVMAVENKFQYVFSSYTTTKSGSAERNTNLYLSCKAINGTILAPGDTFSFNEIVGPRTADKGYQSAPIVGGMGRGGGICQVSTTLFNVALYGNMGITERRQHSVAVTYVPMGRDAMIYKTASDLKFVNTSEYYVKILASATGGTVSISMVTREPDVSPASDVELIVDYANGVYTLNRYYQGEVNYTCKSKY